MTKENNEKPAVELSINSEEKESPCMFSRMWIFLLVLLLGVGGTLLVQKNQPNIFGEYFNTTTPLDYTVNEDWQETRLTELVKNYKLLSARIDKLEKDNLKLQTIPVLEDTKSTEDKPSTFPDDLTKLKEGVKTLFETSKSIGTQLREVIDGTKDTHTSAAYVLAYMRIKDNALQGMRFSNELEKMIALGSTNEEMNNALNQLKEYAKNGVATHLSLYDGWNKIIPKAANQIKQADAKNWKERVSVALNSLVSIKPLNEDLEQDEQTSILNQISNDLLKGDVTAALNKIEKLDTKIQQNFVMAWTEKAKDRIEVERLLSQLSEAMILPQSKPTLSNPEKTNKPKENNK